MLLVENQRSGDDAVGGKGGGCARRGVGNNKSKVGAAALFDAGLASAKAKAARKGKLGSVRHFCDGFNLTGEKGREQGLGT